MRCAIGFGFFSTMSTVWSSTFTNSASAGTLVVKFEPEARTRWAEKSTSSAVKGEPSWNLTFLRRWKRQRVGSGVSQDSAEAGGEFQVLVEGDEGLVGRCLHPFREALLQGVGIEGLEIALEGEAEHVGGLRGQRGEGKRRDRDRGHAAGEGLQG